MRQRWRRRRLGYAISSDSRTTERAARAIGGCDVTTKVHADGQWVSRVAPEVCFPVRGVGAVGVAHLAWALGHQSGPSYGPAVRPGAHVQHGRPVLVHMPNR